MDGATLDVNELNLLDGVTASTSEINILDGVTVSTADINRVGGTSATTAELNLLSGVTALTSLPGLSSSVTELNTLDGLTADTNELNILDGATITTSEINKLDGFTGEAADLNFAKDLRATGVTSTELDVLDGGTSATSTTVASGDRVVYNDDGTMKQVAMSDIVTFLNDSSVLTLLGAQSPGNAISGLTASAAELNILDGATLSTTEINYVDGVTSAIQTQLNAKAALGGATFTGAVNIPADSLQLAGTAITATAGELNILDGVTATSTEINKLSGLTASTNELNLLDGVTATTAEINYLDGVTSNIQTQLDGSVSTLNPTFTGTVSIPTPFNIGGVSMTATAAELNTMDGVTASTGEINVLDGLTATTSELNSVAGLTSTTSELNILDGATLSTNELNLLDGCLASTAELSIMDGATSATSTVVASADRVVYNDDGTMKQVAMSDIVTFLNDASVLTNVGGGSNAVSAASNFGTDNVLIKSDGTSKGSQATGITIADSTNNMSGVGTISSGAITSSGVVTATGITIGSAAILEAELEILDGATVTTDELNLLDGVTASTSEINILDGLTANKDELNLLDASGGSTTTLATGDAFIIGDADASNATKKVLLSDMIALINTQTLSASTTGNAATATAATTAATLATARTIAGVSFDGSANITIAPTDLTGVTATAAEINILDGATLDVNELNLLDGVTASTSEINILDGLTADKNELNLLDASAGSSIAVASGDAIIIGDASDSNATKKTTIANLVTFLNDASVLTNVGSSIATALVSLSGVSSGATDLGTFTGSTIADNQTIKQALQANETAIELRAPIANPTFTGEIGIGSVNVDETELGILEGATVTTAEINKLDGVTASTAQLNIVSGKTLLASGDSFSDSDNNLLTAAATKDIITGGSVLSALKFSNSANNLISSTAVSGTDTAGKNLTLAGGQGTGTGAGGSIVLQVAPAAGSTGTSANSLATAVTITSDKAVALEGALTVAGNLTVNGTTTTVSTTNTLISDKLITLNDGGSAGSGTATGLEIEENGSATGFFKTDGTGDWTLKGAGTAANAVLTLDVNATKTITVGGALSIEADSVINQDLSTDASPQFTAVTADLTGDVTGNADTATTLATARNIGGVSFDGSANINLPGVNTAGSQDTSGNAATATALATARTIAGQSFDGSANISIAPTDLTSVTSTATEINILDAGTSGSSVTLADGDSLIIGDASASNETKKVLMSDVQTYISASGGGLSNVVEDTSPQLGGMLDVNGQAIGDGTRELLTFTEDGSAVNHINIENQATGSGPIISAAGDDSNINLELAPKGSGLVNIAAVGDLAIAGTAITATAAEINILASGLASGDIPNNAADTSGTAAIATTVTITDNESTNEDNAIIFTAGGAQTGGNLGLESDGTLTYNPSTGKITATGFIGALTGDVTGDVTGNADTATKIASITNSDIVQLDSSQTLTNKTLTSPTVSGLALSDSSIVFEGSTANTNETTLTVADPTGDRTITLPDHDITAAAFTFLKDLHAAGVTVTELDTLDGISATVSEINILDGVESTASELNLVDGSSAGTIVNSKAVIYGSSGEVNATTLQIAGTSITATAAEINLIDGGTARGTTAVASGDGFLHNDGGTMRMTNVSKLADRFAGTGLSASDGVLSVGTLNQDTTGNAATATLATTVTVSDNNANSNLDMVFTDGSNALLEDNGAFYYNPSTGTLRVPNLTVNGTTTTVDTVTMNAANAIVFEGATADAHETTLSIVDPTADHTYKLPDLGSTADEGFLAAFAADPGTSPLITATPTELNYVDGVTSAIQTQLDAKQATITGAATTIDDADLTASRAVVSSGSGKIAVSAVTSTELGYLDGVTSAIQTQLDAKQATITGAATTIDDADLTASRALVSNASGKVAVSAVTSTELGYLDGVTSAIQTQIDNISGSSGIASVAADTTPQLGGDLDTNDFNIKFDDAHGILDDSGNEQIRFQKTASAVNFLDFTNAATGDNITLTATGSDTNVGMTLTPKGSGLINIAAVGDLGIGGTAVTASAAELNILDGVTATASELNIMDGVTSTTAELNILDGVTATAAEINLIDGGTARGTTAVASGDGFLHNDGGTMRMTNVSKLADRFAGSGLSASDGVISVDTLNQDTTGNADTATLATTVTVSNSTANTNFPVVFHNESNGLLDDTGALRYNPSTGELLVPKLTVAGTTTTVDTVTMQAANAIVFEGATADAHETTLSIVDPTADHTYYLPDLGGTADTGYIAAFAADPSTTGLITATPAELNIMDGVTSTTAELNILDGVTATASELNIMDGVTATTAEINLIDGGTARGTTAVASGDGFLHNDGGTMRMTNVSKLADRFAGSGLSASDGVISVGTLNQNTTGRAGGLDAENDRDLAPEDLSYSNDFNVFFTSKEGLEDGTTSGSNYQDAIVLNTWSDASGGDANLLAFDKSEMKIYHYQADQGDSDWGTAKTIAYTDSNITGSAATVTTAAQPNITSLGTLTTLTVDDITINGSTISDAGELTIDAGGDIILDAAGDDIILKEDGTAFGRFKRASGDFVIKSETSNKHILLKGNDGGSTITALDLDMENGGAATFAAGVTATGFTIGSAAIGEAELEILDGATVTTTELNILDAGTSGSSVTLADGDSLIIGDTSASNETKKVLMSDVATYIGSASGTFTTTDITGQTDLGNNANGSDSFVIHDASATALREMTISNLAAFLNSTSVLNTFAPAADPTFTGTLTAADLDISGDVDIDGTLETDALSIASTTIAATAAEINAVADGGTSASSITIAEADQIAINDGGTMKQVAMTTLEAYMATYLSVLNSGPFLPGVAGTPGDKEIPTYDNSNSGFGTSSKLSFNGTHGQSNGLTMTNAAISAGSDIEAASRTNNTNKQVTITTPHYHNSEEDVQGLFVYNSDGTNSVCIGGGNSTFNAATEVKISAAANDATVTGTEQVVVTSSDTVVKNVFQGYKTSIKAVSSNTTLTDADSGKTIYWTSGTLTLPATAEVGQQFVIINNTNGAATPGLGTSNAIATNWTAHAAMADETARTYICPVVNKWIYIG